MPANPTETLLVVDGTEIRTLEIELELAKKRNDALEVVNKNLEKKRTELQDKINRLLRDRNSSPNPTNPNPTNPTQIKELQDKINELNADIKTITDEKATLKTILDKWTNLFPLPLTPEQVKIKYDRPIGNLTQAEQDKLDNYNKVKSDLDKWIATFKDATGKEKTPQEIKDEIDKLKSENANPKGSTSNPNWNGLKLKRDTIISQSLNNISDDCVDCVSIKTDWTQLIEAFRQIQEKIADKDNYWTIRDAKLASELNYFTNGKADGKIYDKWSWYREYFTEAKKLFPNDDFRFGSLRALHFLQNCFGDMEFDIIYRRGMTIPFSSLGEINKSNNNSSTTLSTRMLLKDISSEYWDRVEVDSDWDREYLKATNTYRGARKVPMVKSYNKSRGAIWDRKFRNQLDLNNFRKYVSYEDLNTAELEIGWGDVEKPLPSKKVLVRDITINDWLNMPKPTELTELLKRGNKLFEKDGYGKATSKEAFEYLKSIVHSPKVGATIKP